MIDHIIWIDRNEAVDNEILFDDISKLPSYAAKTAANYIGLIFYFVQNF